MDVSLSRLYQFVLIISVAFQLGAQNIQEPVPSKPIQTAGDVILFALPAITLSTTIITNDKEGVWQFSKGLLLTEAITYALKLSISKSRPDLSDHNSFPSGHTSTTFHSAGFIHRRYGFKYGIPMYLLAGFTAASRINSNKHDIIDVIAGAAIGLGSNLLFTSKYQREHFRFSFSGTDNTYQIGLTFKF